MCLPCSGLLTSWEIQPLLSDCEIFTKVGLRSVSVLEDAPFKQAMCHTIEDRVWQSAPERGKRRVIPVRFANGILIYTD